MNSSIYNTALLFLALMVSMHSHAAEESSAQSASGTFEVNLKPQYELVYKL